MQVLGLCRFSYPGLGGYQVEHDSVSAREAHLYDPKRMELRFALFQTITLPSIRAQVDQDFVFAIVIGDSLPSDYKTRLAKICADVPSIQIIEKPAGDHRTTMREVMQELRDTNSALTVQFRLDDDDAVACTFVQRVKEDAERFLPCLENDNKFALDYCSGLALSPKGSAKIRRPYWTPALAVAMDPTCEKSILDFPHQRMYQMMPTVTQNAPLCFVRAFHNDNDSTQNSGMPNLNYALLDQRTTSILANRFGITAQAAMQALTMT